MDTRSACGRRTDSPSCSRSAWRAATSDGCCRERARCRCRHRSGTACGRGDIAGSRALRSLSDATAARLLECVLAELPTLAPNAQDLPTTAKLIRELVPEVTDATLIEGMESVVQMVGRAARQRDSLPGLKRTPLLQSSAQSVTDGDRRQALEGLVGTSQGWMNMSRETTIEQIRLLSRAMTGEHTPDRIVSAQLIWPALVGRIGAVAFRACSPATQDAERRTLVALLGTWRNSALVSGTPLRVARVSETVPARNRFEETSRLTRTGGHVWLIDLARQISIGERESVFVEAAPDGAFSTPPGMHVLQERRLPTARWDEPRRIERFLELLHERGPLAWQPRHAETLAERTGLTRAEATLLLAGLPGLETLSNNFLEKHTRERLALKVPEASAARDSLKALSEDTRLDLLAAAIPSDPEQLWDADTLVDRLSAAWIERVGRRASVPEDVIVQLRSAIDLPLQAHTLLAICADAAHDPRLNEDGAWEIRASPF